LEVPRAFLSPSSGSSVSLLPLFASSLLAFFLCSPLASSVCSPWVGFLLDFQSPASEARSERRIGCDVGDLESSARRFLAAIGDNNLEARCVVRIWRQHDGAARRIRAILCFALFCRDASRCSGSRRGAGTRCAVPIAVEFAVRMSPLDLVSNGNRRADVRLRLRRRLAGWLLLASNVRGRRRLVHIFVCCSRASPFLLAVLICSRRWRDATPTRNWLICGCSRVWSRRRVIKNEGLPFTIGWPSR